jgi:hypothetical protein
MASTDPIIEEGSLSFTIESRIIRVECPVFSVPVAVIETGLKGADDGTRKEAYA